MVIWFTGMSGSGKTTLSKSLISNLKEKNYSVHSLDGDTVRKLNNESTHFTKDSILNNNYSIIEKCVKAVDQYDFVIVSVISPYEKTRRYARKVLKEKYFEIYIKCSLETLILRDTKGFYQKALNGEIDNLIGFSSKLPYEEPDISDLIISTDKLGKQEAIQIMLKELSINL